MRLPSRLDWIATWVAAWAVLAPVLLSPVVEQSAARHDAAVAVPAHSHAPGTPLVHPHSGSAPSGHQHAPDGAIALAAAGILPAAAELWPVANRQTAEAAAPSAAVIATLAGRPRGPPVYA